MNEFAKYRELKAKGSTPRQIYLAARVDGLDEITSIRLLRFVCDLSLAEAKRVTGEQEVFEAKQDVRDGATVYWEGADSVEGYYLMQARVARIGGAGSTSKDTECFESPRTASKKCPWPGTALPRSR